MIQPSVYIKTSRFRVLSLDNRIRNVILCIECMFLCWVASSVTVASVLRVPSGYVTIQSALDSAQNSDTILVADGTYTGEGNYDLNFQGKSVTLQSEHGAATCVLDCQMRGRAVEFKQNESNAAIIQGITFQNGYTIGVGGAIKCVNSSPTIRQCRFISNRAYYHGGAIECYRASPLIIDCEFLNNNVGTWGGAICCLADASPSIEGCVMTSNTAGVKGGALYCEGAAPRLTNCQLIANSATFGAACIFSRSSSARFQNCLVTDNHAQFKGGAIYFEMTDTPVSQCTFTRNTADIYGGAFYCERSSPTIQNSILWRNSALHGSEIALRYNLYASNCTVSYCDIQGGVSNAFVESGSELIWGDGMLEADPVFVENEPGSVYLSQTAAGQASNSPCVDAGSDSAEAICFQVSTGVSCMNQRTTRTDRVPDQANADMGFHY